MRIAEHTGDLDLPPGGCVLVPTMGALHLGHLALVRRAREARPGLPVVVSVFVNPTQFNDAGDLARYPRTLERDVEACAGVGVDVVFAPPVEVVYPAEGDGPQPALPRVATEPRLEDGQRPGHFAGVCQVVRRLFELVRPGAAVFGEKDYQQLRVVSEMTEAEGLGVEIVAGATVRERDGLAMSSRNVQLSPEGRRRAPALFASLREASLARLTGSDPDGAEGVMRRVLEGAGVEIDYAVVRDAGTLLRDGSTDWRSRPMRAVVAGRIDGVRLLDNGAW